MLNYDVLFALEKSEYTRMDRRLFLAATENEKIVDASFLRIPSVLGQISNILIRVSLRFYTDPLCFQEVSLQSDDNSI
jgi:hypothetical protein